MIPSGPTESRKFRDGMVCSEAVSETNSSDAKAILLCIVSYIQLALKLARAPCLESADKLELLFKKTAKA